MLPCGRQLGVGGRRAGPGPGRAVTRHLARRDWLGAGPPPPPLGQSPPDPSLASGSALSPRPASCLHAAAAPLAARSAGTLPARPLGTLRPGEPRGARAEGLAGVLGRPPPPRLHHPHAAEPGGRPGPSPPHPPARPGLLEAGVSAPTCSFRGTRGCGVAGTPEGSGVRCAVAVPSIDFSRRFGWETAVSQTATSRRPCGARVNIGVAAGGVRSGCPRGRGAQGFGRGRGGNKNF